MEGEEGEKRRGMRKEEKFSPLNERIIPMCVLRSRPRSQAASQPA